MRRLVLFVALITASMVIASLLLACSDKKLTPEESLILQRACLDAGMNPRIRYYSVSNEIADVVCEPK